MKKIEKGCTNDKIYFRNIQYYHQARDGFYAILKMLSLNGSDKILMPAYIGFSPREGSGVFDPVKRLGIQPVFYHLDKKLQIIQKDLEKKMEDPDIKVLLMIHYFGFPDKNGKEIAQYARKKGIIVIEDEAHALFTDFISGICGRWGDYSIFSLHKMLPVMQGGMVCSNGKNKLPKEEQKNFCFNPFFYDFKEISEKRKENYQELNRMIRTLGEWMLPLYPELPTGVIPQTYPIILKQSDRNQVYKYMNEKGFGVVSLYHTMIDEIRGKNNKTECEISDAILNLPVHQDVNIHFYQEMIKELEFAGKEFQNDRRTYEDIGKSKFTR